MSLITSIPAFALAGALPLAAAALTHACPPEEYEELRLGQFDAGAGPVRVPAQAVAMRTACPPEESGEFGVTFADGRSGFAWVVGGGEQSVTTIEARRENGEIVVSVNGERLPRNRLRISDDGILILGENGKPMESLPAIPLGIGDDGSVRVQWKLTMDLDEEGMPAKAIKALVSSLRPGQDADASGEQRKVMLGVTLAEPDEALSKHLRLERDEVALVTQVMEGLPADKAGIETFDIIVSVDGATPAGPDAVREAIASKSPGDVLKLEVRRGGERKTFSVTLEAFEPSSSDGQRLQFEPMLEQLLRNQIRIAPLPGGPGQSGKQGEGLRDFIYELVLPMTPTPPAVPPPGGAGRPALPLLPPGAQAAPGLEPGAAERLERLERRLDELSRRLERIVQRLEREEA